MADIDSLDFSGLQLKDNNVLVNDIQTDLQAIYSPSGEVINFESGSPDGSFSEVLAQIGTTIREIIQEVYNCGDPSKCSGAVQDKMYQINYLTRRGGTFTRQNIEVTVDKTVELQGLDGSYADPNATAYTVSDDAGNLWYLIDTTTLIAGTTSSLPFRAKEMGAVTPTIGTITNQVTIVGGVTNVVNELGYTILGIEEESDAEFRIRRDRSVALAAQNSVDATVSQIFQIDGVTAVTAYNNNTNTTDANGTPAHTVWYIVGGGANTEIASAIYTNLGGSGTRGEITVPITTISGQTININFDRPTIVPLYIRFDLQVIGELAEINVNGIKEYIATNLIYAVGENAETSKVTEVAANAIEVDGGGAYALNVQISTGGTATAEVSGTGITDATVNVVSFEVHFNTTNTYVFEYNGTEWEYEGDVVDIEDYGIAVTGTPVNGDTVLIDFTAGTWTNFIPASSIANEFVTDATKITINPIEA